MSGDGITSPSGRHTFVAEESAEALLLLDELLAEGKWSLTMSRRERLSVVAGVLSGTIARLRGMTEEEGLALLDTEFMVYCGVMLDSYEAELLREQMERPSAEGHSS
jgi:hypothetical protein